MSALNISISRKRPHFPGFGDDNSESGDDFPPRKKHRHAELPVVLKTKLQRMTDWFMEIKSLNKFARMALRYGATLPVPRNPKEIPDDSEEDEEEDEEDVVDEEDDDEIQEIKENVNQGTLSPLIKQLGKTHFSSDSGRPKQKVAVNGGCYSLSSKYNNFKQNGAIPRELSTRYHGTTSCNLSRDSTENLKRKPLISNPATEIEIILGHEPEVITLEGDGIEILSESSSSKQKSASSQKSLQSSVKSSSKNDTSAQKTQPAPVKKSSAASKFYTANEVVRLQEKAQYKLLLEKYISGPQYRHVSQMPESAKENKDDSRVFSNDHFKKQVLEQPVRNFIEKYYTPCRLLPSKESSEKKQETPEITIDDDEDDVQVIEMKLPKYKAVFKSPVLSTSWLHELRKHVHNQTEERIKIVEDYEKRLEKYKKERLLRRLRVDVVPASKPAEPEFPELTPEMEDAVDKVLTTGAPGDFICKTTNNELIRKDFDTLSGLHWLNDTIINSYFDLIVDRGKKEEFPSVYAFNTFFYGNLKSRGYAHVRRWTRKIDIFSFDINFVPIHLTYHWCLAVIDHRSKKICYYDSMGTSEEDCLNTLHEYLCLEYKDKKGKLLDPSIYVTETMKDNPQQMNGSDCGMFTLKYAEYISRGAEITFDQSHMQYFRRRTVYELLTNQLL